MSYLSHFCNAVRFITILPFGTGSDFEPRKFIPYFPLVGILLGVIVAIFDFVAISFWPTNAVSFLDVVLLLIITGAFHVDGLGDTADGLLGLRSREKALDIMKDSRVGAMGLVAIICSIGIKWLGIWNLEASRYILIIIIPAYSRAAQLFGIRLLPYGRADGTGHALFGSELHWKDFWGLAFPLVGSLFLGGRCFLINGFFLLLVFAILSFYKKRMGCITGDMLGAMTEVTESSLFLVASMHL